MPEIVLLEGWMLGFEALPDDSPLLGDGGEWVHDLEIWILYDYNTTRSVVPFVLLLSRKI